MPQKNISAREENNSSDASTLGIPVLLGPSDVRAISEAIGIHPTKVLGQNFVHDAGMLRRMVRSSDISNGDEVLEVGPGLGSLTLALLEAGARVRAVEIDERLARALPSTIKGRLPQAASRFHVTHADAMNIYSAIDLGVPDWPLPTKLVANLPYNVAVPVLLSLLEAFPSIDDVLVMVQSEVADRLSAKPGSKTYGVPSVKTAWYGHARRVATVGRGVFWPVPNVDSALVRIQRASELRGNNDLRLATFNIIDVAFGQRRKMIRSAFRDWLGSSQLVENFLSEAEIDSTVRGETLGIEDFVSLGQVFLSMKSRGLLNDVSQERERLSTRRRSKKRLSRSSSKPHLND